MLATDLAGGNATHATPETVNLMGGRRLHFAAHGVCHFRGLFNLKASDVHILSVPSENF